MRLRALWSLALLFVCSAAFAEGKNVTIFENRKLAIDVPEGWTFESQQDDRGIQTLLVEEKDGIRFMASFIPDSENRFGTREGMLELMKRGYSPMLEGAVEKELKPTFVDTADGIAGWVVLTDKQWVGKKDVPENERRYATAAMRSWKGVLAMLTILSNDIDSPSYQKAMSLMTSGLRQVSQ